MYIYFQDTQISCRRTSYKNLERDESTKSMLRNSSITSLVLHFTSYLLCYNSIIIPGCSYVPAFLMVYQHLFAFSGSYFGVINLGVRKQTAVFQILF